LTIFLGTSKKQRAKWPIFSPKKNHWDDHIPKEKGKTIGRKRRKMKKEKERKTQK
jgi:hypothetical protein